MEEFTPLQQPGGLGPLGEMKPLGMPSTDPSAYSNTDASIRERQRVLNDNVNRVFAQYNVDHGSYLRSPVSPVEYGIGNIKTSNAMQAPAGYNHKLHPMPNRPEDMPVGQYMFEEANLIDPTMRLNVGALSMIPQQNFYNETTLDSKMPLMDYRMSDNMSLQEQVLTGGKVNEPKQ